MTFVAMEKVVPDAVAKQCWRSFTKMILVLLGDGLVETMGFRDRFPPAPGATVVQNQHVYG